MKKAVISFTLAILLLLSISTSYVNTAKAQPIWIELGVPAEPFNSPPTIQIISPNQNQTFTSPYVLLNFSVEIPHSWVFYTGIINYTVRQTWGNITSVSFSLDDNQPQSLTLDTIKVPYLGNSSQDLNFSTPLNLAEGTHIIRLFVSGYTYYVSNPLASVIYTQQLASVPVEANSTISFNVALPTPIITSPQNIVYNERTIPLQVKLASSPSWIEYSLDGKTNITITGNTTLIGLSNGEHYLTIYTNDTLGNSYASQTIAFSVKTTDPYLTIVVIVIPIAIVCLIAGLLIYRRHRKTASLTKTP
jgi:hypothetical protein